MATRISRQRLENLVRIVAELQKRPLKTWSQRKGENGQTVNVAAIGALQLDHNSCYGGWDVVEIVSDGGGESSLIGNDFGGRGRVSAHELESFLLGMIAGQNGTRYWPMQGKRKPKPRDTSHNA